MEPPSEMDPWGLACSKTPLHRQGVEGTAQAQKLFLMPQTCARLAIPSASIDRPSGQPVNRRTLFRPATPQSPLRAGGFPTRPFQPIAHLVLRADLYMATRAAELSAVVAGRVLH